MNNNKLNRVWIIVTLVAQDVVIDGPNVWTDRVCKKHHIRFCKTCYIESKKNYNNPKYWDRTLDIERLEIVSNYVKKRGYKPHFFVYDATVDYLIGKRKELPEIKPKLKIINKLARKKEIMELDKDIWKKQGHVVDDIWWITYALEKDALILTNDKLRDWKPGGKYARTDLDWEDIENRRIEYIIEPKHAKWNKFGDKCEEQTFVAAELETLSEMTPRQKMEMLQLEDQALDERKKKIHQQMESLAVTNPTEIKQKHDFFVYEEQIIDAWLAAFEFGEGALSMERTSTVWCFVIGYICGLNWFKHIEDGGSIITWINHPKFDELTAKENLGYGSNESNIRILEDQFNLVENKTKLRFKFSPDQEMLMVLNFEDFNQIKKGEEE